MRADSLVRQANEGAGGKSKDRAEDHDPDRRRAVFLQLPLKTEAKVVISGLYITEIKSVRGGIPPLPERKSIFSRIKGVFIKKKHRKNRKERRKK